MPAGHFTRCALTVAFRPYVRFCYGKFLRGWPGLCKLWTTGEFPFRPLLPNSEDLLSSFSMMVKSVSPPVSLPAATWVARR